MSITETDVTEIILTTDSRQPDSINNCICF